MYAIRSYYEPFGKVGVVRGTLPADAHVFAQAVGRADGHGQQLLDCRIALIEGMGDEPGITISYNFV